MKQAILFDMDGLMVDSNPTWIAAEKRLVEEYGKKYSDEIAKKYHGLRVHGMIEVMIKEYNLPLAQQDGEAKLKEHAKVNFEKPEVKLLPGCKTLVTSLSQSDQYSLAVASSSPITIIQTVVNRFNFNGDFDVLVSGEEVKNGKPAPDVFLRAAQLLHIEPTQCLVLEDAPNGIKAAKAAHMKAIAVNNTSHYTPENFQQADAFVASLEDISIDMITKILQG